MNFSEQWLKETLDADSWLLSGRIAAQTLSRVKKDVPFVGRATFTPQGMIQALAETLGGESDEAVNNILGDELAEVFRPVGRTLSTFVEEDRGRSAAGRITDANRLFARGMLEDPLEVVGKIGEIAKGSPTFAKIAIAGTVIAGLTAAHRISETGNTRTEEMLQMSHPGSEAITRVAMNDTGYGGTIPNRRTTPRSAGGAFSEVSFPGMHATINVGDNMDSMSTGQVLDMME
jgi:hypothetical protein